MSSGPFYLMREREGETVETGEQFASLEQAGTYVDSLEESGKWPEGWDAVCRDSEDNTYVYEGETGLSVGWNRY